MKLERATVISNEEVIAGVQLLRLDAPEVARRAKAGQFVMVNCQTGSVLPRPFSIHQVERASGRVSLLFAIRGAGTAWLAQLGAGDMIQGCGPLGNAFSVDQQSMNILIVAGGLGIAPLTFLATDCVGSHQVVVICGAASRPALLPRGLLPENVRVEMVTEDGSSGRKGLVTDAIPAFAGWADRIYACGPLGMYRTISEQRAAWPKAVPVEVSLEVRMGCGTGICYGCTVRTREGLRQVCVDGPVFQLEDVLWDSVVC